MRIAYGWGVPLTYFLRCGACQREVRVFDSRLGRPYRRNVKITEDAAFQEPDGTFKCPFCGADQPVPADARGV